MCSEDPDGARAVTRETRSSIMGELDAILMSSMTSSGLELWLSLAAISKYSSIFRKLVLGGQREIDIYMSSLLSVIHSFFSSASHPTLTHRSHSITTTQKWLTLARPSEPLRSWHLLWRQVQLLSAAPSPQSIPPSLRRSHLPLQLSRQSTRL